MAYYQFGTKPYSETMLTNDGLVFWCISGSLSLDKLNMLDDNILIGILCHLTLVLYRFELCKTILEQLFVLLGDQQFYIYSEQYLIMPYLTYFTIL